MRGLLMPAAPSTSHPAAPSPIDASAFDHLTDDLFVCTDEQRRDHVILTLYQDGRLDWYSVPQEFGGVTMDDDHGVSLTWALPTNVRAGLLGAFTADHLDVLERVHLGHKVDWDGRNSVGELDDAHAASEDFRVALAGYADDLNHLIVPVDPAIWFEATETNLVGLKNDELDGMVRQSSNSGKPVEGTWSWVVVDLEKTLASARAISDEAANLADEQLLPRQRAGALIAAGPWGRMHSSGPSRPSLLPA